VSPLLFQKTQKQGRSHLELSGSIPNFTFPIHPIHLKARVISYLSTSPAVLLSRRPHPIASANKNPLWSLRARLPPPVTVRPWLPYSARPRPSRPRPLRRCPHGSRGGGACGSPAPGARRPDRSGRGCCRPRTSSVATGAGSGAWPPPRPTRPRRRRRR
jgi:hypothetical protein